jgi:acyl carrier protein
MSKDIQRIVCRTIEKEIMISCDDLKPSASFSRDLKFSLLDYNVMLYHLENKFNIHIQDSEIPINSTVEELILYINSKLGTKKKAFFRYSTGQKSSFPNYRSN